MSTAWVFPGQGSQAPASGAPWRDHPAWELVEAATAATGVDVAHLLLDADEDELRDTANAQLSTFVVSLVVARGAADAGRSATHFAGHSLGEYTALVAAGAIAFDEGCRLVNSRGIAMRGAATTRTGTMAAIIGLEVGPVTDVCNATPGDVWVANDNAPGQVVIAGEPDSVTRAGELAKERGARRPMPLNVAGAFHTPLMAPAQTALDAAIQQVEVKSLGYDVELWANVDAAQHDDPANWPTLLSDQLTQPVRWREEVAAMAAHGVTTFVELGPGTVLSGMVKRISPEATRANAATPDEVAALPSE
jgi:[acyl-carrier-protein] S-malonyltransferase